MPFFYNQDFNQGNNQNSNNQGSNNPQGSNLNSNNPNFSSQNQSPSRDLLNFGSSSKQFNPSPNQREYTQGQREYTQGQRGYTQGQRERPDLMRSNQFHKDTYNENMSGKSNFYDNLSIKDKSRLPGILGRRHDPNSRLEEIDELQELNKEQRRTGTNKIRGIQGNQNLNDLKKQYSEDQQSWIKEQNQLIGVLEQINAYQQSLVSDNEKNGIEIETVIEEQGKILNLINEINNNIINNIK